MKNERQRAIVLAECQRRGITIQQQGKAWVLRGPGVDLLVADLASVTLDNLEPHLPRERMRA